MAFDFPTSPAMGEQYTSGGVTYVWNGYAWDAVGGGGSGVGNALVPTDDLPPIAPLDGQLWWKSNSGAFYIWYDDGNSQQWVQVSASPLMIDENYVRKTAEPRNYIINAAMRVSQEYARGTNLTTSGAYAADQWFVLFATTAGVGFGNFQGDEKDVTSYIRINASVADAAVAATDYCGLNTILEGTMVHDFKWGTPYAVPAVLRFKARSAILGTFAVSVRNYANTRCWSKNVTFTKTGEFEDFELAIPPDTTGTWDLTTAGSMSISFYNMLGGNFIGAQGWNNSQILGQAGVSNWFAVTNQFFDVANVGLYRDPENTGKAPAFEIPEYDDEVRRCKRYWQKAFTFFSGNVTTGQTYYGAVELPVEPRAAPTLTGAPSGQASFPATIGTLVVGPVAGNLYEQRVANATGVGVFDSVVTASARM